MNTEDDNARKIKDYYDEWIRRYSTAKELLPSVVRGQENATWQVEALDTLKLRYPGVAREVNGDLAQTLEQLRATLPLPPVYSYQEIALSTSSSTAQANISVVQALVSVRENVEADAPITRSIETYTALQLRQGKPLEVRERLNRLFPSLDEFFLSALHSYEAAKVDASTRMNAALAMRNFIEKLQGELFEKARTHPRENMTWETMASRLGGVRSPSLAQEGITQGRLHDLLSKTQKGWPVSHSVADVWPQFLDHTFVVCGYVLGSIAAPTRG